MNLLPDLPRRWQHEPLEAIAGFLVGFCGSAAVALVALYPWAEELRQWLYGF